MNPRLPLSQKILNDGEPRHYQRWDFPGLPRLHVPADPSHRHHRSHITVKRRNHISLSLLINALRKSK